MDLPFFLITLSTWDSIPEHTSFSPVPPGWEEGGSRWAHGESGPSPASCPFRTTAAAAYPSILSPGFCLPPPLSPASILFSRSWDMTHITRDLCPYVLLLLYSDIEWRGERISGIARGRCWAEAPISVLISLRVSGSEHFRTCALATDFPDALGDSDVRKTGFLPLSNLHWRWGEE